MYRRGAGALIGCALAAACSLALAGPAAAASFFVDDLDDFNDQTLDGVCDGAGAAATCSLRAALEEAAFNAGGDTVFVSVPGTINLTNGSLDIVGPDTLNGNAGGTTIDAGGSSRVFTASGSIVGINDVVIQGGAATGDGGGINSAADTLNLGGVTVTGNTVDSSLGGFGGGGISTLSSSTALVLNDSTVSGNTVTGISGPGGGIRARGPVTLDRSTISGNSSTLDAGGSGGGINMNSGAALAVTVINSTISGNHAGGAGGGGILAGGNDFLTIKGSTIAGNTTTDTSGGGVRTFGPGNTSENTIYASNTSSSGDDNCGAIFGGTPESNIDTGTTCGFGGSNGNQQSVTAGALGLAPLGDNGGPTLTHALEPGSVALEAAVDCAGLSQDQRGVGRPQGTDCDIGAFEARYFNLTVSTSGTGSGSVAGSGISCPGDCAELLPEGTVALTPTPAAGSDFSGWSGACTGAGACVVALDTDRAVTAGFALEPAATPPPPAKKKCKKGRKLKKGKCVKKRRKKR